jgi:hypothetical protein
MTKQLGWKFEPFDDAAPDKDGYYTFRFDGPLYALVEPQENQWTMQLYFEDSNEPMAELSQHQTLEIAQRQAEVDIMEIFKRWAELLVQALENRSGEAAVGGAV